MDKKSKHCESCICKSCEQVAKLEQELEDNFKLCSGCSTTHSFNLQLNENKKLKAENEQLKQTLQEIKETAEQSDVGCIYRISVIRAILTKAEEE